MTHKVPDFDLLERIADALAQGNWRAADEQLVLGGDAGGHRAALDVMYCQRRLCHSMRLQCALGDVQAAWDELDRAAAKLVEIGPTGRVRSDRRWLPDEPAPARRLDHLVWATTRVVLREQADLDALRAVFRNIGPGRLELIYAAAEYEAWVGFDPWTARVHPLDQELLGLDDKAYLRFRTGNPTDICRRATHLRHFADVRQGPVSRRTWHRMGGYPLVREAALMVIAAEARTRGRMDFPVRLGRLRAWKYARRLAKDTPA